MQAHLLAVIRLWKRAAIPLAVLLVILLLWRLPRYQVAHTPGIAGEKRFDSENEARKTLAQLLAGAAVLLGLYFSAKTFGLSREGHITDRFTKAIEQLGKTDGAAPNIEVRLGAIYALERIAIDSPRDHWTIMEILTAYIRRNCPLSPEIPLMVDEKPRTDIQAILTVLGRRRTDQNREPDRPWLSLSKARLCGADLTGANLRKWELRSVDLRGATLDRTDLVYADLREADLRGVQAFGCKFSMAHMENAKLQSGLLPFAEMSHTFLSRADLEGANLQNVDLREANIHSANFSRVESLKADQVIQAKNWPTASFSPDLHAELGQRTE